MGTEFLVVMFYSNSAAMRAETLARRAGLVVKLVPVPRHLSSDCGVALRFRGQDHDPVRSLLQEQGVEFDRLCPL
jgi:hypothetical protein